MGISNQKLEFLREHAQTSKNIGERLIAIRNWSEMTRSEFAKLLGCAPSTLYNYEKNRRRPDAKFLDKLKSMGWPSDWILFGITTKYQKDEINNLLDDKLIMHHNKIAAQVRNIKDVEILLLIENMIDSIVKTFDKIKENTSENIKPETISEIEKRK